MRSACDFPKHESEQKRACDLALMTSKDMLQVSHILVTLRRRELADRIEVKNQMIAEQGHPEGNRQQRRLAARMERKRRQREGV